MPPHALPGRHALVQDLAVEVMDEGVSSRNGTVRPFGNPLNTQELPESCQRIQHPFDLLRLAIHSSGDGGGREFLPRHARRLQQC